MPTFQDLSAAIRSGDAATAHRIALEAPALLSERGPEGVSPILLAAYHRQPLVLDSLVVLKPHLDLWEGAAVGRLDAVQRAIDSEPALIAASAPDGFGALGLASFFGHAAVADWLLGRGADPNQPSANSMKVCPLHSAAAGRHLTIARLLLQHGADPDARQHKGFTALMSACRHGHAELVCLLLDGGADPRLADEEGKAPLDYARESGDDTTIALVEMALDPSSDHRPLGVICAIPEEIAHFGPHFIETKAETVAGFVFRRGRLDGQPAIVVETGIGKVNAATVATLLLDRYDCRLLLFSGVAGGLDPDLGIGDVVVADRLVQHDYGAVFQGQVKVYQPGNFPLPGMPEEHGYALRPDLKEIVAEVLKEVVLPPMPAKATGGVERAPNIVFGTILTGDQYVNCEATRQRLFGTHKGRAVEMEGAAIAQVAERYGAPWIVVRSLSDLAGQESHMDFQEFVHAAAAGAAGIVLAIVRAV